MKTVFIYSLNDPDTGRARYVGKAEDPYARYEKHLKKIRQDKTHKGNWIRSLLKVGKNPVLEVLDVVPEGEWQFWECEWIRLYRALMFNLTNSTEGGEGVTMTPETRAKISAALTGLHPSLETRIKLSAAKKGKPHSAERRAKKRKPLSVEHRSNISTALKGKPLSAEHGAKMRAQCARMGAAKKGKPWSETRRAAQKRRWEK